MATLGNSLPQVNKPLLGQPVTPLQALSAKNAILGVKTNVLDAYSPEAQMKTFQNNLANLNKPQVAAPTVIPPAPKPVAPAQKTTTATAPVMKLTPPKPVVAEPAPAPTLTPFQQGTGISGYDAAMAAEKKLPITATAGQVVGTDFESEADRKFREEVAAANLALSQAAVDPSVIRKDTMARFQNEIDALNRSYAIKKQEEAVRGENRMGQVAAIGARRGLLGSDFGVAQADTQTAANVDAQSAIEAERLAGEAAIYAKAEEIIQTAITGKQTAKKEGTDAYLKYISENTARKKAAAEEIAKMWYNSGYSELSNINELADKLGISVEALKSYYANYKKAADASKVKSSITLSAGESIYNPNTGKIEMTAPTDEKPVSMSPGSVLVDPKTGKPLFTAPDKPTNPLDYMKEAGGYVFQYNPETGNTTATKSATEQKLVTLNGESYIQNADGTYSKPNTPVVKDTAAISNAQNKITAIDSLLTSPGFGGAVGIGPGFVRTAAPWNMGAKQDFIAGVEQLISKDTLDTLINLKKAGGTLGALSDQERIMLQNAASKISTWKLTDDKGKVTGYKISEDLFKKELENIKSLSQKALNEANAESGTQTLQEYYQSNPDKQGQIEKLINDGLSDEEIQQVLGFNSVGGDTESATLAKAVAKPDGTKGGQCGRFVNNLTGLKLGDSFQSKMAKMDPTITWPEPGMVFTMPYKDTGHTGIIVAVNPDNTVTVKDSNYNLDEKVKTHKISLNKIAGLRRV